MTMIDKRLSPGGCRLFHGHEAQYLQQVVLHDVADDAELVEVAAAALRAERLRERDQNAGDVIAMPLRHRMDAI